MPESYKKLASAKLVSLTSVTWRLACLCRISRRDFDLAVCLPVEASGSPALRRALGVFKTCDVCGHFPTWLQKSCVTWSIPTSLQCSVLYCSTASKYESEQYVSSRYGPPSLTLVSPTAIAALVLLRIAALLGESTHCDAASPPRFATRRCASFLVAKVLAVCPHPCRLNASMWGLFGKFYYSL